MNLTVEAAEHLQENGWVPFGSFQEDEVLALGNERFMYNPTVGGGVFLPSDVKVPPRFFDLDHKVRKHFLKIVGRILYNGKVPDIYGIPLVYNWEDVLNPNEIRLETTEMDKRRRATFDLMPEELKWVIWKAYYPDESHAQAYMAGQPEWVSKSRYLFAKNKGAELTREERANVYVTSGVSLEFRVNFALQHPDWMEQIHSTVDLKNANIRAPYEIAA